MRAAVMSADADELRQSRLGLLALVLGLGIGAAALYAVAGGPRLPSTLPTWDVAVLTLGGSDLPLEALAYILTTAAWAVWLWLVVSVILRLLVLVADAATQGAAWVGALRAVSDRVTLPIVRRLVDGALVAAVVINLVGRSASSAAAAPAEPASAVALAVAAGTDMPALVTSPAEFDGSGRVVEYTVQPGDTLWAIAERFYGTGTEFPRLVAVNVGRDMPDGGRFTRAGVIRPGWPLAVPLPSRAVEVVDRQRYYIVEEGDSLRGIAARLLGDEARWPEIFDMNRDTARLTDGRTLTDPDLIWPGLWLRLPSGSPEVAAEPPEEAALVLEPSTVAEPELTPTPFPPEESTAENGREPGTIPTHRIVIEPAPTPAEDGVPPVVYGAAGLAAAAVAGSAALLVRRRVRRSLREPPVRPPPRASGRLGNGFAEAEPARAFTHRLFGGEVEQAQVVAEHVLRFLAEEGLTEVAVLAARHERNTVALTLSAGLAEQTRLLELARQFGTRLGVASEATLTSDYDVLLRVSGLKAAGLMVPPTSRPADPPWLVPLGVLPSRETLYANWRELEHVLVAGLPGGGTETVLAGLLAALTARCRPDELRLWTIASRRTLPDQLLGLPHQHGEVVDPTDNVAVGKILAEVRAELARRMRDANGGGVPDHLGRHKEPELVLVIGELAELEDDGTTLEIVGAQGSAYGVRLLAATTQPEALGDDVLAHFDSRLILQTLDEDQSIHVLGQPDAADLAGGELLARIDGRAPTRARGFRVSADHLDELVRLMREAYGSRSWGAAPWPTGDASTDTAAHSWDVLDEEPPPPPVEGFSARVARSHLAGTTTERQDRPVELSQADEDSGPDGPQPAPSGGRAGQLVAEETVPATGMMAVGSSASEPLSRSARESLGLAPASESPSAAGTRDREQPSGQQQVESVSTVAVATPDRVADRDAAMSETRSLLQVQCFGPSWSGAGTVRSRRPGTRAASSRPGRCWHFSRPSRPERPRGINYSRPSGRASMWSGRRTVCGWRWPGYAPCSPSRFPDSAPRWCAPNGMGPVDWTRRWSL
jgi:hypothetical protein